MEPTLQSILNGICENLIANGIAWMNYREVGRNTECIQTNLLLLNSLYLQYPFISATNTQADLEKAQNIINITTVPN